MHGKRVQRGRGWRSLIRKKRSDLPNDNCESVRWARGTHSKRSFLVKFCNGRRNPTSNWLNLVFSIARAIDLLGRGNVRKARAREGEGREKEEIRRWAWSRRLKRFWWHDAKEF